MIYINFKYSNATGVETVSEYPSTKEGRKQAREDLAEYRLAGGGQYWLSNRSTKDWRES